MLAPIADGGQLCVNIGRTFSVCLQKIHVSVNMLCADVFHILQTVMDGKIFSKPIAHCVEIACLCFKLAVVGAVKICKGNLSPIGDDFWKKELRTFQKDIVEEILKNPKYTECFA